MMTKRVLVTGATSDIGESICRIFHKKGWDVVAHYFSSESKASSLRQELNIQVIQSNLTDQEGIQKLTDKLFLKNQKLDSLVNNAALYISRHNKQEYDDEEWSIQMKVNAEAPYQLSSFCKEKLISSNGSIINITDALVTRPQTQSVPYYASKGALETLTHGLARQLGLEVRVNGVAPGPIDFPDSYQKQKKQKIIKNTLLERTGTPEEIARAVYFLADQATYTSGSILYVDGGSHIA